MLAVLQEQGKVLLSLHQLRQLVLLDIWRGC